MQLTKKSESNKANWHLSKKMLCDTVCHQHHAIKQLRAQSAEALQQMRSKQIWRKSSMATKPRQTARIPAPNSETTVFQALFAHQTKARPFCKRETRSTTEQGLRNQRRRGPSPSKKHVFFVLHGKCPTQKKTQTNKVSSV